MSGETNGETKAKPPSDTPTVTYGTVENPIPVATTVPMPMR